MPEAEDCSEKKILRNDNFQVCGPIIRSSIKTSFFSPIKMFIQTFWRALKFECWEVYLYQVSRKCAEVQRMYWECHDCSEKSSMLHLEICNSSRETT